MNKVNDKVQKMKSVVFLFLFIFLCSPAHANEVLTWDDCVQEAVQHNPDLAGAEQDLKSSKFLRKSSYSGFFPDLSVDSSYNFSNSPVNSTASSGSLNGPLARGYSANLALNESVFSGFLDKGKVAQGKANVNVSEEGLNLAKVKLSFDLKNSFAQLLFSQEQIKVTAAIATRREEDLKLIELRFEGGNENKGSYLLSEASYHQAEFEHEQAQRGLLVAERQLLKVLGRPESDGIQIKGKLTASAPKEKPDFAVLAQNTPDYLQAISQTQAAKAQVTITKSFYYPEVSVNGSVFRQSSSSFTDRNGWSTGVNLSYLFPTSGKTLSDAGSAEALHAKTEFNRVSVLHGVIVKLQQTFVNLQDAVQQMRVDQEFLEAARTRAEIARAKYNNGLLSFEDWDIIENDLITREKNAITSRRDAMIAEAAWEQAQGKGSIP
jgi:outer membrane protein